MKISRKSLKSKNREEHEMGPIEVDEKKLEKIYKIVSPDAFYNKLKYQSEIYNIGDCILVNDSKEGFLVAKLLKIIQLNGFEKYPYWPTIQVQWYYKKSDINRGNNNLLDEKLFNSISEFEIFESTHSDIIFIESIIGSCEVYTFEEYENLMEHTQKTFFTRASYDPVKECLIPSFDSWEKSCLCQTPLNPDQLYIKCDSCDKWYHPICCGIDETKTDDLNEFYCKFCAK